MVELKDWVELQLTVKRYTMKNGGLVLPADDPSKNYMGFIVCHPNKSGNRFVCPKTDIPVQDVCDFAISVSENTNFGFRKCKG